MKKNNTKKINKKTLDTAVRRSVKLEGMSFTRAKKNTSAITLLKKYGRAFSV